MVKLIREGFTLLELLVTIVMASILVLTTICMMVATVNFNKVLKDEVEATREARIVVSNMTSILRFGTGAVTLVDNGTEQSVQVSIEDHHLGNVPANSGVIYRRTKSNNELRRIFYDRGTLVPSSNTLLSSNVSDFQTTGSWDGTNKELTLKLVFITGVKTVPVESRVKFLGS